MERLQTFVGFNDTKSNMNIYNSETILLHSE